MKDKINIIDIHTHILPNMDDGPKTNEESNLILDKIKNDGITSIIFTPHFYPRNESPQDFITRRNESLKNIKKSDMDYFLGAEVRFYYGIASSEIIDKLTLGNSNYILLELPFEKWDNEIILEIERLIKNKQITPIIAHFNRYLDYSNKRYIKELKAMGCLLQANTEFLLSNNRKKQFYNHLKNGYIDFIASDCHNTTTRINNLKECLDEIKKSKYSDYLNKIYSNYNVIINALKK